MNIDNLLHTIETNAPKRFRVSLDAPNTYPELISRYNSDGILTVYSGASDKCLYPERYNHLFRAWHDMVHIDNGLTFSFDDELEVARIQCSKCKDLLSKDLLWLDIAGQVWYYETHKKYVDNQAEFVYGLYESGLRYGDLPN